MCFNSNRMILNSTLLLSCNEALHCPLQIRLRQGFPAQLAAAKTKGAAAAKIAELEICWQVLLRDKSMKERNACTACIHLPVGLKITLQGTNIIPPMVKPLSQLPLDLSMGYVSSQEGTSFTVACWWKCRRWIVWDSTGCGEVGIASWIQKLLYFEWSPPWHVGWGLSGWENERKNGEFENIDFRFPWLSDTSEMVFGHDVPFLNYSDRLPHPSDLCQPDRVRWG